MAITEATEFDRVRLSADLALDFNVISDIDLMRNGARVEWLPPIDDNYLYGWDPTTTEFGIVRRAVESGDAEFEYVDKRGAVYSPGEDVPAYSQWMVEGNPIKNEIDLASSINADDFPPVTLAIYKASVSAPTDDPPEWSATNNTWNKWRIALETAGYYITVPTLGTGESLWSIKATYGREEGHEYCHFDSWRTGGRRYSIDNGRTWSTTPPHPSQRITHIQSFNAGTSEWESEPYSPQYQGDTGSGTEVAQRSTAEFTKGNRFIQAASMLPRKFVTRGIQAGNTTHLSLRLLLRTEWLVEPILRGSCEILIDQIPLTAPHEVSEGDVIVPVAGKTMLVAMTPNGGLSWGFINSIDRLNDYLGDHPRFTAYWLSNPIVKLQRAVAEADTTMRVAQKPTGITTASTLYISRDGREERARVSSVNHTQQGTGDDTYYEIGLHRHPVGNAVNPPQAWPVGTQVTADHPTQRHDSLVITGKRELHAASELHIWVVYDQ